MVLESQLAETNWVLEDCCCSEMSEAAQRLTVPARLAVPVAGRWPVIGYVLLAGRERRSFGGVQEKMRWRERVASPGYICW